MNLDFKYFIRRLVYFIPLFFLLSVPVAILVFSGEFLSLDQIIKKQTEHSSLVGIAYSEINPHYKFLRTTKLQPTILSLGTSRVMQFRDYFFTQSFFNAGGGVARVVEFEPFVRALPESQLPQVIIIGLDQYFFNVHWDKLNPNQEIFKVNKTSLDPYYYQDTYPARNKNLILEVSKDIIKNKINLKKTLVHDQTAIGINAIMNGNGYRPDGSYFYHAELKNSTPLFTDMLARIGAGNSRFEYNDKVNPDALLAIASFLNFCKEKNIKVIGFTPPYAQTVWDAMDQSKKYSYINELPAELHKLFTNSGFSFYNFSNPSSFGSSDGEFIDGLHGSEVSYLRILIAMSEQDKSLGQFVDTPHLKTLLDKRVNGYTIK